MIYDDDNPPEGSFEKWSLDRDLAKTEKLRKECGLSKGQLKTLLSQAIAIEALKRMRTEVRDANRSIKRQVRYLFGDAEKILLKLKKAKKNGRRKN